MHGQRAILQLQQALGSTTRDDLIRLFRMIDAHEDLVGLHQVLPRLARVAPWLDLLWIGPAERYAGLTELAAALCRAEIAAHWRNTVPEHRSSRSNVANSLTGQLDRYPHYALYMEFVSDRSGEQEARVAPLIALYTLLSNAGLLTRTLATDASRRIRGLLDPSNAEARAMRARFPEVEADAEIAWQLYDFVAGQHGAFEQLVGLAKRVAQQSELRHRSRPKVRRRLGTLPLPAGPLPPGIRTPSGPPVEVSGGPASPGVIDTPPEVIEIPEDSPLEPEMAMRTWSAWNELQHQYLYWQWRTLNPQEIAVISGELARLLAVRDLLGLLLGLSLATARSAVDVLAIRLRKPDSADAENQADADADYWLDLAAGVIEHPSALPKSSYDPDAQARAALLPVAQRIRIALPPTLVDTCRTHLLSVAEAAPTLGEALGLNPKDVQAQVRAWCEDIRRTDPRVRLSPTRLR
nr:hypothetical protein [Thiocapsa sp. KS1]